IPSVESDVYRCWFVIGSDLSGNKHPVKVEAFADQFIGHEHINITLSNPAKQCKTDPVTDIFLVVLHQRDQFVITAILVRIVRKMCTERMGDIIQGFFRQTVYPMCQVSLTDHAYS